MNKTNEEPADLAIIGGGITGLSAAYLAAKQGNKVVVVEANENFGGLLSTFEIGGNRLDYYYHHFFTHDKELNWLVGELGLTDRLFYKKTSMGVYKGGKIYNFNSVIDLLLFNPIGFIDKLKFGLTSLFLGKMADWRKYENVSCAAWFEKWAGKTTTRALWAPLLKIKFGPFAEKVPLAWMIGRMRQRMNSRKNGDERLGYMEGSLQALLDKLLAKLKQMDVKMKSNSPVQKIIFSGNSISAIQAGEQLYRAKKYLFTIPTTHLAAMLENEKPAMAESLARIEYFGAVCVVLELKKPLSEVYWLNIADENFEFGGIIEHTNFIGPENYNGSHIAYLSRYFSADEKIARMTKDEIKELMVGQLSRVYPEFNRHWLKNVYVFKTNTAATVCDLNFSGKIPDCQTPLSNMFISTMSHVYPDERSTNNSIRIAMEACRVMGMSDIYFSETNSLSGKIGFEA